ncbi:MAG TPA: hypothetical protein VFX43_11670 [Chitinophagaceae bacterium]|jgi:hypothetical protein|nr:hypothetical protein [Chitinophagaceae bacterium]
MKTIGIILIIIGIVMIILKGINFQTEKKVAEVGPIEINKTENNHIGWPTYAGGAIGIIGIILVVAGAKTSKK